MGEKQTLIVLDDDADMAGLWTQHGMARARMAGGSIVAALTWLAVPGAALAQPGYECRYEREGDFGKVSAQFEVPRKGQPSEWPYLRWEAPVAPIKEPHVGAGFFRTADGRVEGNGPSLTDKRRGGRILIGEASVEGCFERFLSGGIVEDHLRTLASSMNVRNGSQADVASPLNAASRLER